MKKTVLILSILLCMWGTCGALRAQIVPALPVAQEEEKELQVMTLSQCIEAGLEHNYSIRIQRNQQAIAERNATRGNAGQLPTVGLTGSYSGSSYQPTEGPLSHSVTAGAEVSWTLFNGLILRAEYSRLKELKSQSDLQMQLTLEDYIAGVESEYYNLIRQRIRLFNLQQSVTLSRERLRIVRASFQLGASSGLDYQQAQVDFNADTSALLSQAEAVRKVEIELNRLLAAENVEVHIVPADTTIVPSPIMDRDQIWHNVLNYNVQLQLAKSNKALSEWDYRKAVGRNYPYLRLNAGYGYRNTTPRPFGVTLGATAGFTLFDAGNRVREQRNAKLTIENRDLAVQEMELTLQSNMASLWMAYCNNLELWEIEKNNLEVARSNFSIAMERYRLRELSGIELREAQLSLLTSEERLSTVEYNIKLCEISLRQISGTMLRPL